MTVGTLIYRLRRNKRTLAGETAVSNQINLEWWSKTDNLGDYLAGVIYDWVTEYYGLDRKQRVSATKHLLTVGSLISMGGFDATVWGSGIHCVESVRGLRKQSEYRKYDIRAVRGPVTRMALMSAGFSCPEVYGDPAILMPKIYNRESKKRYEVSVILHMSQTDLPKLENVHYIDIRTTDYKAFIDEILASEKVISSSLHGIILAESYGVPAIFCSGGMKREMMKFIDWYFSTGRLNICTADTVEEAMEMEPMPLPNLESMQQAILEAFPKDLWEK